MYIMHKKRVSHQKVKAMIHLAKYIIVVSVSLCVSVQATIFDNRYIPFLERPYIVTPGADNHFSFDLFFATASQAFGQYDREVGVPELFGVYNQNAVAKSFVNLGCPNPMPSRYQDKNIIWDANGKIVAQGFEIWLHEKIWRDIYVGFYWYCMRVNTTSQFFLNINQSGLAEIPTADVLLLDRTRRCMNAMAGLVTGDHAAQGGPGDVDAYIMWDHLYGRIFKFRSIHVQARVGGLLPAGQKRNINEPTSIPFGGDGFWGAYVAGQCELELKEDWKVGTFAWISKRFERTLQERIPLHCEPMQYAPMVGDMQINPGPTFVWSGWVTFEGVHKGLGARILLTVRKHNKDSIKSLCTPDCSCINSCALEQLTEWGSDYITLNAFYDFGKISACRKYKPIVFFAWDIPSNLLVTQNAIKTNKVMLGVELSF